ncbi:ATP-dependent helicase [Rhizobium leguminosarum]|uniref:UvrD-helicase domain-containing protein n=1 Tax=Rhizobium leguminosarum TaxID=384 RepID=UPI00103134D2|nr:UvrD-helicase domain-containing protein [Rhizobium leguminosarum]TBG66114.1 ATP-dependent helicase [Rhizobium leguminosarum]TBG70872.1 ATP-dependent helicase [Rhizobium leguminosarum]
MIEVAQTNPAEVAAAAAWEALKTCLDDGSSFVFEAGAGAGKTYSLIAALRHILKDRARELQRAHQQVACITYTNVARDMIIAQTDGDPVIYCDTTHAFAWMLISPFQKRLRELVCTLPGWADRVEELDAANITAVGYALGRRSIEDGRANLHHNDIFPMFIELVQSAKFRNGVASRFPIILVDEYQDTNAELIECLKDQFIGKPQVPQLGFFGDHWQKIYGDGCGSIVHEALKRIDKKANFRSSKPIVDSLNLIRPELAQAVKDPAAPGEVQVFHTNGWGGKRLTANHWQGSLPALEAARAFKNVRARLESEGWDFAGDTKVLMLTHRALATEMGYSSMRTVFEFSDSFTRKANEVIAYFHEHLEPAARAYLAKRFGKMFEAIDAERPVMNGPADKARWSDAMRRLCELRGTGTVGGVIAHLSSTGLPILSDAVVRQEKALSDALARGEALTGRVKELHALHAVSYQEIIALCEYLDGHSPFETKHGVKGDQFENVLVVFGRGWNEYDFNLYLKMAGNPGLIGTRTEDYERYRNLFYVAVSRPKRRLALLFTHLLEPGAVATLAKWFPGQATRDIGPAL